eukprot:gene17338-biopygen21869
MRRGSDTLLYGILADSRPRRDCRRPWKQHNQLACRLVAAGMPGNGIRGAKGVRETGKCTGGSEMLP